MWSSAQWGMQSHTHAHMYIHAQSFVSFQFNVFNSVTKYNQSCFLLETCLQIQDIIKEISQGS